MAFQSSHVAASPNLVQAISVSTNGMMMNPSCNRSINLGFPTGPVHSNMSLPLSNITGESSVTDYQDCGLSPMFLTGESPWDSNLEVGCPEARDKAKMRYNEKKKTRMYVVQLSTCRICNYIHTGSYVSWLFPATIQVSLVCFPNFHPRKENFLYFMPRWSIANQGSFYNFPCG